MYISITCVNFNFRCFGSGKILYMFLFLYPLFTLVLFAPHLASYLCSTVIYSSYFALPNFAPPYYAFQILHPIRCTLDFAPHNTHLHKCCTLSSKEMLSLLIDLHLGKSTKVLLYLNTYLGILNYIN